MNWDDAKYFLAVARAGQMLGAATRLGVSQAMLSRRVSSLEAALDCKLFERSTGGCVLTPDGAALMEVALRVEAEFETAKTLVQTSTSSVSGTVRIGAPDGFGVAFLSPRLHVLTKKYPLLNVQLVPVPRSFSLSQREADIAVMVGRPQTGRLRARKLTDYSLGLYAAKSYLKKAGMPAQLKELNAHSLVGYVEDLIFSTELNYNTEVLGSWESSIEISSALGQFEAVKAGAGIGVLHDFMAMKNDGLVNLFPEVSLSRNYWTVWHESMKNTRRISVVAQFLDNLVRMERGYFNRRG